MKTYTPSVNYSESIETAKELLKDLGVDAYFASISVTNYGTSVYFYDANDVKIRVSDHSVTNVYRLQNEIHLYFDEKTLSGVVSKFESNKRTLALINY